MKEPTRRAKEWLTKENLLRIEAWARDGLTDEQIAHNMGVAYSTFRKWRDDYKAISAVLKRGKEVTDIEVENSLHKKALGYYYEEEKTFIEEVNGVVKRKKEIYKKYAQPDTGAIAFWLKNRKPEVWKDRVEYKDSSSHDKLDAMLDKMEDIANE